MSEYKRFSHVVAKRPVAAWIQTTTQQIRGTIYVRRDQRVSDALREAEAFIAVTDAVVLNAAGEEIVRAPFLALNKAHILWVMPEEEEEAEGAEEG